MASPAVQLLAVCGRQATPPRLRAYGLAHYLGHELDEVPVGIAE